MDKNEIKKMKTNSVDVATGVFKGTLGAIPIAGPAIQEILSFTIPNQRLDRIVSFVEILSLELEEYKGKTDELIARMSEDPYSSLFYKACVGSADSYSDERIEYIKNIFIYGLNQKEIQIYKAEGLLNILNRITDIEVVYLNTYYLLKWDVRKMKEYQEINGISNLQSNIHSGMSREEMDDEVAKEIYLNNLTGYGLLEKEIDKKGKTKYKSSSIGDLLIRTIMEEEKDD